MSHNVVNPFAAKSSSTYSIKAIIGTLARILGPGGFISTVGIAGRILESARRAGLKRFCLPSPLVIGSIPRELFGASAARQTRQENEDSLCGGEERCRLVTGIQDEIPGETL